VVIVTGTSSGSFNFTVSGSPASPATGTIVAYQASEKGTLEKYDYYKHTNGGSGTNLVTIYPLADSYEYSGSGALGERKTTYAYGFASSSVTMTSQTTNLPLITAAQNGPAATATNTASADMPVEAPYQ